MTDLRERLHDTLDHQHTDLAALAIRAQHEGGRLRRRHRVAAAGGSLAVLALLGAGTMTAAGLLDDEPREATVADQGLRSLPGDSLRRPADALVEAVSSVVPGSASDLSNDKGRSAGYPQLVGELTFAPADGSPAGPVSVTYAKVDQQDVYPRGESQILGCGGQAGCQTLRLDDGSTVRAIDSPMDLGEAGVWEYLTVDRIVGDTWLHFEAQAPRDWSTEEAEVLADHAPLTLDELIEVASLPMWEGADEVQLGGRAPQ